MRSVLNSSEGGDRERGGFGVSALTLFIILLLFGAVGVVTQLTAAEDGRGGETYPIRIRVLISEFKAAHLDLLPVGETVHLQYRHRTHRDLTFTSLLKRETPEVLLFHGDDGETATLMTNDLLLDLQTHGAVKKGAALLGSGVIPLSAEVLLDLGSVFISARVLEVSKLSTARDK